MWVLHRPILSHIKSGINQNEIWVRYGMGSTEAAREQSKFGSGQLRIPTCFLNDLGHHLLNL